MPMDSLGLQECSLDINTFRQIRDGLLSVNLTTPEHAAEHQREDDEEEDDEGGSADNDELAAVAEAAAQERASFVLAHSPARQPMHLRQITNANGPQAIKARERHTPQLEVQASDFTRATSNNRSSPVRASTQSPAPADPRHASSFESVASPPDPSVLRRSRPHGNARPRAAHTKQDDLMEDVAASIEPSDTQYIPSQVFTDFLTKTTFADTSRPSNIYHRDDGTSDSGPKTYGTGETGHVNLSLDIDTNAEDEDGAGNGESEDELGQSQSQSQSRDDAVTSPAPLSPITPAITGQKRDRHGNAVVQSTPMAPNSLAAMFKAPAMKGTMGLSQVFKHTQAATSPLVDAPKSDPIFERPSPDARALNGQSSPGLSSPAAAKQPAATRAISDPREMYVPMKDSQEVRERQRKEQLEAKLRSSSRSSGDEDELGEDSEQRRAERRRRRAEIDANAKREFSALFSSSAPNLLDRKSKTAWATGLVETPAARPPDKRVIYVSDDTPQVQAQTEVEYEVSEDESADEYDEFSQSIISRSRRRRNPVEPTSINKNPVARPTSSPFPVHGEKEVDHSRLAQTFHAEAEDDWNQDSGTPNHLGPSQSVKVADSQPDRVNAQHIRPDLTSSVNSKNFVSQSQGLTMSTNIFTDFPPHSEVPESSSIPHAPPIPFVSMDEGRDTLVSASPPSSPPSTVETVPSGSPFNRTSRSAKSGDDMRTEPDQVDNEHSETDAQAMRKPVRTIIDTSPASAKYNRSSPGQPYNQPEAAGEEPPARTRKRNAKAAADDTNSAGKSRSTTLFETAPTHLSSTSLSQAIPSNAPQQSPKVTRIRKMRSIDPSPVISNQESPVNASFDVLNEDDHEYEAAISDPFESKATRSKRAMKTYSSRRALQEPAPEANVLPAHAPLQVSSTYTNQNDQTSTRNNARSVQDTPQQQAKGKLKRPSRKVKKDYHKTTSQDVFSVSNSNSQAATKPVAEPVNEDGLSTLVPANDNYDENQLEADELNEEADSQSEAQSVAVGVDAVDHPVETTTEVIRDPNQRRLFPNRVLARFRDLKNYFYSATCIGKNEPHGSFVVKYDDNNIDRDVSSSFVRSLELRVGDIIKVDRKNLRGKDYIIRELRNIVAAEQGSNSGSNPTDIYGHQTLLVDLKLRDSLGGHGETTISDAIEVGITEIYLTSQMWHSFADRTYDYVAPQDSSERLHTPIDVFSRQGTPSSRSRRPKKATLQTSVSNLEVKSGIFSNMVFAITYDLGVKGGEQEKDSVSRMISDNGGRLLSGNFDELFETQSWFPNEGREVNMNLSPTSAHHAFAALITDKYSRRIKYIQALALNIPCLSGRWVSDSVTARTVLPWTRYLLPAGESDLLGGTVRSRTFSSNGQAPVEPSASTLSSMLNTRPNLFAGQSIIVVMGNKRAKVETRERRKLHVLLSCALGARRVARVTDVAEARTLVAEDQGSWDFLNVDDDAVKSAKAALAGDEPRKKRASDADTALPLPNDISSGVKVIGEEFLVQSLIAGALLDTP